LIDSIVEIVRIGEVDSATQTYCNVSY